MFKKSGTIETTYIEGIDVPSIRYRIFQDMAFVKDGFSTRIGGVSTGQYSTLNFSVKMGDASEHVQENFRRFLNTHGFTNPVMTDQTHTTNVMRVTMEDAGKNVFLPKDYSDIDGFITNEPGLTLVTTFADCVPLYFVDEKHRAIGMAHSGWKGTYGRIGKTMVLEMQKAFGTRPEELRAAIGPSICGDCYEVSEELGLQFCQEFSCEVKECTGSIPVHDMEGIVYCRAGKYYLNLWAANVRSLKDAGVLEEHIAIPDICTCCNYEKLFSHRASKGKRGNLCGFLMIKK